MHGIGHLVEVFFLLLAAQLVGWLFARFKQPVVIGEVLAGLLVGPALLGLVHDGEILEFLAELGAIFLLFMVGLETRLRDILAVGKEAFLVALLGVLFPFVGGYFFGQSIGFGQLPALFLGTALVATSVGITARVLLELGVLSRSYSRIILGAAVIDDVLGLIVLAVVNGVAQSGTFELGVALRITLLSVLFVGGAMLLVPWLRRASLPRFTLGNPFGFALLVGVGLAALAATIGLAPIVGAFLAGMLLAEVREELAIEEHVRAVGQFLTPIFFAMVGVRLELAALLSAKVWLVGSGVLLIALLGKLLGGFLGALSQGLHRAVVVGIGMAPRGEVGLIVAALGLAAGAVNEEEYALVLFMVVGTTLLAPLFLRPAIAWAERRQVSEDAS
ncbi:cation:proton antiporter [Meiothermus sp.]|uniref:cation:proton antiporter n=1 Tax=Meiothermus sp. TaxID=1955249 RepID=UPI0021DBDBC0|nr:cation:proton antiporter [Meiothermus sp.]GIW26177.1 MAG: sodium:proton antiporter [Meiothermus sp.]